MSSVGAASEAEEGEIAADAVHDAESAQQPTGIEAAAGDERLNFFSPRFDAARALATAGLVPPHPSVRAFDYLTKCRFILPAELPEALTPSVRGKTAEEIAKQERFKMNSSYKQAEAMRAARRVPVVSSLAAEASASGGPLAFLAACVGGLVRLVTRHAHGVRGSARGRLLAVDKHMNLVLADVDESYAVLTRVARRVPARPNAKAGANAAATEEGDIVGVGASSEVEEAELGSGNVFAGGPAETVRGFLPFLGGAGPTGNAPVPCEVLAGEATAKAEPGEQLTEVRWFRKQEHRRRHLPQIFVRGDAVVLLARI